MHNGFPEGDKIQKRYKNKWIDQGSIAFFIST